MKQVSLLFTALVMLNACAFMERVGSVVTDNEVTAYLVISQATARFVGKAEDPQARAQKVLDITAQIEAQIDENPTTTIEYIKNLVLDSVDLDQLEPSDKLLLIDLMVIAEKQLLQSAENGELTEETKVALKSVLSAARSGAAVYL